MSNTINIKLPQEFFKTYAREQECQIRIAGIVGLACNHEPGATMLCHPSIAGLKAMGSRRSSVPDIGAAWGCNVCHDICDGRITTDLPKQTIQLYLLEGVIRTIDALVKAGILPNP